MKKFIIITATAFSAFLMIYNYETVQPFPEDKPVSRIIVNKAERKMHLFSGNEVIRSYKISLGFNPVGAKEFEGDGKTPEGVYIINDKNPNSGYYLNLGLSYPDSEDIKRAKAAGKSPGGDIKIHGMRNGFGFIGKFHRFYDWTHGCIAVTNREMKELFDNVPLGTEIIIKK